MGVYDIRGTFLGPYFKGVLYHFQGGLVSGSPIFVNPHMELSVSEGLKPGRIEFLTHSSLHGRRAKST